MIIEGLTYREVKDLRDLCYLAEHSVIPSSRPIYRALAEKLDNDLEARKERGRSYLMTMMYAPRRAGESEYEVRLEYPDGSKGTVSIIAASAEDAEDLASLGEPSGTIPHAYRTEES